jgi:hypothetical protein
MPSLTIVFFIKILPQQIKLNKSFFSYDLITDPPSQMNHYQMNRTLMRDDDKIQVKLMRKSEINVHQDRESA